MDDKRAAGENGGTVVALRYDEPAIAQDLAAWCGGSLEEAVDPEVPATIWVPTEGGPRPASLGMWIVRRLSGGHYTCTDTEFAARHEPTE